MYVAIADFGRGQPRRFMSHLQPGAASLTEFGTLVGAIDHAQSHAGSYLREVQSEGRTTWDLIEVIEDLEETFRQAI